MKKIIICIILGIISLIALGFMTYNANNKTTFPWITDTLVLATAIIAIVIIIIGLLFTFEFFISDDLENK